MSISSRISRRSTSKLPSPSKKKRPGGRWFETVVRPVGAEEDRQFFNAQASWAVSCGEYVCRNTYNTPRVQGDRATRNTREACGWRRCRCRSGGSKQLHSGLSLPASDSERPTKLPWITPKGLTSEFRPGL